MRAIAVCALALLLGGSAEAGAQVRAEAPRDGTVAVRAADGSVRIVGWSRAEVSAVSGDDGDRDEGVRVVRERGVTAVRARGQGDLVVRVPAGSRVEVKTRGGDISVEGVDGALDMESTSGGFRVGGTPRMVTVEGLSGDVQVTGSTETLRIRTVSGSVRVPRAQGFVEASSISGDVQVTGRLRRATLRSTSGRAVFAGSVPRDGSLHLESTSGIVELRVPAGIAADFDLSSLGGGQIESALGPRPTRQYGAPGISTLRFSNGSGGAEITARTVTGIILLKKQ
ncbi:MAG TPA: DUF4097 family beta strand repeat-containing protein [Longimicrobiaceae bacterium]|nr:DUF4097 family beta strand repeat-containing protein [Longimicrobiaceae bacterium]